MASPASSRGGGTLTAREREILGLLATGLSGAGIAEKLVLSPETVRTHVRNAMSKLGASTRSQAVVMALRQEEIGSAGVAEGGEPVGAVAPVAQDISLDGLADGLAELHDIDAAVAYVTDEDGMRLRLIDRGGAIDGGVADLPDALALGEGPLGRAALERRAQLVPLGSLGRSNGSSRRPMIVAPMVASGKLVGIIGLSVRASRPTGRGELLLAQAFATRVGEIVAGAGEGSQARLDRALERFRASWSATTSV